MARAQPKYHHISEQLLTRLNKGEWQAGERLPGEVQIAEEYGVSYMTVRNAISELVKDAKLRRVRGRGTYAVPNENPDTRPSLGLLLTARWHSVDPFYFPCVVDGFVSRAAELGFQVHIADQTEPLIDFLTLKKLRVSAVACVLLGATDLAECDDLLDRGVLVVAINNYSGSRRIPAVSPNNRKGAYDAASYLIRLGHENFVYLQGPEGNFDAMERQKGIELALQDAAIPLTHLDVLPGGFMEDSGYAWGKKIALWELLPTAILTASDLSAIGLIRALTEQGVSVPQDVSVFGFGDFRLSSYFTPALTTVRLPLIEIGRHAADALVEQYRGVRSDETILECPLVIRESVAPPRNLKNVSEKAKKR